MELVVVERPLLVVRRRAELAGDGTRGEADAFVLVDVDVFVVVGHGGSRVVVAVGSGL